MSTEQNKVVAAEFFARFTAFRDGKICAVREYLDTQHAYDVWIRPSPSVQ